MSFSPGPLMQALSKIATVGQNFYSGGWGDGQTLPMPQFQQPGQQPQGISPLNMHEMIHGGDEPSQPHDGFWSGASGSAAAQGKKPNFLESLLKGGKNSMSGILGALLGQ